MSTTSQEYDRVIVICRQLYSNKMKDYGSAWRILRLPSLTDQIFIKAQRIRSLQQNDVRKIDEDEIGEFIGIINYSIMALIQLDLGVVEQPDLDAEKAIQLYDEKIALTKTGGIEGKVEFMKGSSIADEYKEKPILIKSNSLTVCLSYTCLIHNVNVI